MKLNILYTSITGNTKHMVRSLQHHVEGQGATVHVTEITDQSDLVTLKRPYFVFVPTYIIGTGTSAREIKTLALHDEIGYSDNAKHCLGIVASGNRNFAQYFCWTGKHYAREFHSPLLYEYELRGMPADIRAIYGKMYNTLQEWNEDD